MDWNPSTLIPIISAFSYGVIITLVLVSKPRTRLRMIFGFYLLTMVSWSVSSFLTITGFVNGFSGLKAMSASLIVMMLAIFYFVQFWFGSRRKWAPFTIIYGIPAILVTLFTNYFIQSSSVSQAGELHFELGIYFLLVAAPGYFLIFISFMDLIRGYIRTHDTQQRAWIRCLVIGFSITILASLIRITKLSTSSIDSVANGVTALLITYAILRHQLLNVQVVLRSEIKYSITTAIFAAMYYLIISLVLNLFQLLTGKAVILVSGTLTAFLLSPLRNRVQTWIDRIFYREKYNAELMLERLSHTTTSLLDIEKITSLIVSEIINTLHIEHGAILIKYDDSGDFHVIAKDGNNEWLPLGFRADHPIVTWISRKNQPLMYRNLSFVPTLESMGKEEKQELESINAELFLPLNSKGELIGILVLGKKLSSQPYTQDEQLIFSTIANQTAVAIENARLYDELSRSFIQSVTALANAIDIRDTYTNTHSQQIANWAAKTARHLGCTPDQINEIYLGGLLHDIGKIGIPDAILHKPTKLNEKEWKIVHTHPKLGAELISPIIENSHERYDGLGYPYGKKGDEIPLGARIISVVDSYSAMHDKRPYKEPYSTNKIINELNRDSGKMYDPNVVEAFLDIL
jgi:HD-GYP domain-containing protein (c-di-GMP phosphodiesterase class II)